MDWPGEIGHALWRTLFDVLPIAAVLLGFQLVVLRRRPPNLRRMVTGFPPNPMGFRVNAAIRSWR